MINKQLSLRKESCPGVTRFSHFKQGGVRRRGRQRRGVGVRQLLLALQRRHAGLGALPQRMRVFGRSAKRRG